MKNQIKELEEKLRLAMLNSNIQELDKLIADTLIFTAPTGDVINKQFDLDTHHSGVLKLTKLEQAEQNIKEYENFAVVTVKAELEGILNNKHIREKCAYTRVWAILEGKWQVVAGHVSTTLK